MNMKACTIGITAALVMVSPTSGHHSDAGVDTESVVAFEGTVREFAWLNPHAYVVVETQQSGEAVEWELQMGSISGLIRLSLIHISEPTRPERIGYCLVCL